MELKGFLRDIGLTENEMEIYLILLKRGDSIASGLSESTKISRPHVYDSLNNLIKKGMVSYVIKDKRKVFSPTKPSRIMDYLEEKEQHIQDQKKDFSNVASEIDSMLKSTGSKPVVEVYEGVEGAKAVLNDIIRTRKELRSFNSLGDEFYAHIPEYVVKQHMSQRIKYKIRSRHICTEEALVFDNPMATYKKVKQNKILTTMFVYGDNVVIWTFSSTVFITIKIESKDLAKMYKNQFDLLWDSIK